MAVWWVLSMLYFFVQVLSTTLYPDLGCDTSSVWNFCACSSDVISWGNKWWHHESAGVFLSLHVREPKTVLDSGFHAVDSGIQVLNASLCQWNLDSRFQLLVGFRIPWAVCRILKPRILDSTSKMLNIRINFLDSKSGFPYVEQFLGYLLVLCFLC